MTDIKRIINRYENVSNNMLMHAIILAESQVDRDVDEEDPYIWISWEDVAYYVAYDCLTDGDIPLAAYNEAFYDNGSYNHLYFNNSDGIKQMINSEGYKGTMRFIQSDQYELDKPYIMKSGYKFKSMDDDELAKAEGDTVREWMAFNDEYLPDSLSELIRSDCFHHLAEDILNEVILPKELQADKEEA